MRLDAGSSVAVTFVVCAVVAHGPGPHPRTTISGDHKSWFPDQTICDFCDATAFFLSYLVPLRLCEENTRIDDLWQRLALDFSLVP
eukprot:gene11849-biopygen3607